MKQIRSDEGAMRQYLLGELDEKQQEQLEERLMTDSETFEQLLLLEDELVDEYLRGALSSHDQERFTNHFLCTPERHQKLEFASALRKYVSETTAVGQSQSWWQSFLIFLRSHSTAMGWSFAGAALLLIILGGSWSIFKIWRLQDQLDQIQAQQLLPRAQEQDLHRQLAEQRVRNDALAEKLHDEQIQRSKLDLELAVLKTQTNPVRLPPTMVSLILTPGLVRGGEETKKVTIPLSSSLVQLQLDLPADKYESYRAVLQDAESNEIVTQNKLKARATSRGQVVVLSLPAELLPSDDYSVKLSGITASGGFEDVGKYSFRVIKK